MKHMVIMICPNSTNCVVFAATNDIGLFGKETVGRTNGACLVEVMREILAHKNKVGSTLLEVCPHLCGGPFLVDVSYIVVLGGPDI